MKSLLYPKTLRLTLISAAFLYTFSCFAQGCDETVFTDFSSLVYAGNPFNENFISKQKEDKIYIFKSDGSTLRTQRLQKLDTLWVYDINKQELNFLFVSKEGLKNKYLQDKGEDFFIDDGTMYFLTNKKLHIFRIKNGSIHFDKYIKTKKSYLSILGKIDEHLILYVGYNYHPLDQRQKVIISKFSTKRNEIVKSIYPKMLGVELTHSNKRFCTIHNNTILFAQPFSDTICIYNGELERIGNIELKHKVDSTIKINYKEFSTDQIQKMLMEDYLYKRNIKIDVFGDTLLVLFKKKFQNFRGSVWFDIYTHKNNTWELTDTSKFIAFTLDSNKKVLPTTTYVPYIIDNNPMMVHNGFMYELINKHIEIRKPITYKEYNQIVDLAFFENTFKVALQKQPLGCLFKPK